MKSANRKHRIPISHLALSFISGFLISLGFAPFNFLPILFVALVPILYVLFETDAKGAWKSGYSYGLIFALGQLHWLYQLVVKWTGFVFLALIPYLIACALMAIYFGWGGWLIQKRLARKQYWAIPLIWAGIEAFRSYIPVLAFPWSLLASPLSSTPALIQTAHFGTIYFVSAWVLAVNLGLVMLFRDWQQSSKRSPQSLAILAFALVVPILSAAMYSLPRATKPIRVTVGQTGLDMAYENDPVLTEAKIAKIVQRFDQLSLRDKSRLLVLPEGIARGHGNGDYFNFPLDPRVPIIFGAERAGHHQRVYQSAIAYDGNWRQVDKTRLVIFGEFVPARDFISLPAAFRLPSGDLSSGEDGVRSIWVGGLNVGPLLCFEGLFPDLAYRQSQNGASLLAVMSIDDWFMNSSAPAQLRGAAIWRAVESGLPVARAASLGSSLACDGKGRVIEEARVGESTAFTVEVPVPIKPPVTAQLPIFPFVSFLFVLWLTMAELIGKLFRM